MNEFFDNSILNFSGFESDAEFIPLTTAEEEETVNKQVFPENLPILPLRNNVLFPGVVIPITVGRDKSIKLIQEANKGNKIIGVVSQKDQEEARQREGARNGVAEKASRARSRVLVKATCFQQCSGRTRL